MLSSARIRRLRPAAVAAATAAGLLCVEVALAADEADPIEWSEPARLVRQSLLLDVAAAGDRMITVGERGHVLVSDDRGQTWTQAEVPTRSMLTAVTIVDEQTCWAVGHDAVIVQSRDAGRTWDRRHWAPDWERPLFDVWFENAEHGIAVGAYGLLLETTDGGQTWTRKILDESEPHFYRVSESPHGRLYAAGEFGTVYASDDRGRTWEQLPSPYEGSFFGVLALADESVLVFGMRGNLFRSRDGGETWEQKECGAETGLFGALQFDDGAVVVFGQSGNLSLSSDGGETFELTNAGNRNGISSAAILEGNRILLVGEGGIQIVDDVKEPVAHPLPDAEDAP